MLNLSTAEKLVLEDALRKYHKELQEIQEKDMKHGGYEDAGIKKDIMNIESILKKLNQI